MRVAYDLTPGLRQGGGIGRLTRELARALVRRGGADYVLVVTDRLDPGRAGGVEKDYGARVRAAPVSHRLLTILWHRLSVPFPAELLFGPADVYHATDFLAPPLWRTPSIVTVHDLSFIVHPEFAEPSLARFLAGAVPRSLRRARHIVADSSHTKRDLVEIMGVPAGKVTVVYPGLNDDFRLMPSWAELERVRGQHGLDKPFILGVGTLEPRKQWPLLIEAFGRLVRGVAPDSQAHGGVADLALVIAGGGGWRREKLDRAVAEARAAGLDVRLLGFVPDADLPALYRLAWAFAYPSAYEGFGLPPLEALAAGLPTVVTATSSLPEAVGDAALVVPTGDAEALARALARLMGDAALRGALAEAGPRQAARFTWAAAAEVLERVYEATSPPARPAVG